MTTKTETNRPTHAIYRVRGDKEKARWTRIGSAWPNSDGKGFSMQFDAFPLFGGRIVMREIAEQNDAAATGGQQ